MLSDDNMQCETSRTLELYNTTGLYYLVKQASKPVTKLNFPVSKSTCLIVFQQANCSTAMIVTNYYPKLLKTGSIEF